ncbi:TPA: hypothetical protein I7256_20790 [Vibrio vulnificus]|nr:hypothetical protein [Vibrio vulnificus]MCA0767866.1 hypothetical protein [Vibrio vulnificus]HAS6130780.1 hypothetical protein [Vibrio vulnificus]HAS6410385.1 hypothetical protein [Vibrio vulnificus]HAS6414955.1 hypothetical protein [Vibrio vulnificus]
MEMMPKPFVKIDEQAWYCHFRTEAPHAAFSKLYWWFGCQLLRVLKRSKNVEIVNTYHPDGDGKVVLLDPKSPSSTFNPNK